MVGDLALPPWEEDEEGMCGYHYRGYVFDVTAPPITRGMRCYCSVGVSCALFNKW